MYIYIYIFICTQKAKNTVSEKLLDSSVTVVLDIKKNKQINKRVELSLI